MKTLYTIILTAVAIIFSLGLFLLADKFPKLDQVALHIGNVVLWIIFMLSFQMIATSFKATNPNVMLRAKMSGTMLKFFAVVALVLAYVFYHDRVIPNKSSIFVFLGLYVIYMIIESVCLSTLSKSHKNA